jgi:hypothetical protein
MGGISFQPKITRPLGGGIQAPLRHFPPLLLYNTTVIQRYRHTLIVTKLNSGRLANWRSLLRMILNKGRNSGDCSPYILSQQKCPRFPGGYGCDLGALGRGFEASLAADLPASLSGSCRGPTGAPGQARRSEAHFPARKHRLGLRRAACNGRSLTVRLARSLPPLHRHDDAAIAWDVTVKSDRRNTEHSRNSHVETFHAFQHFPQIQCVEDN